MCDEGRSRTTGRLGANEYSRQSVGEDRIDGELPDRLDNVSRVPTGYCLSREALDSPERLDQVFALECGDQGGLFPACVEVWCLLPG